jgi:hypothetical protein
MRDWLLSLESIFAKKYAKVSMPVLPEGVIFYDLKRKAEGLHYRAKLRRDMFV